VTGRTARLDRVERQPVISLLLQAPSHPAAQALLAGLMQGVGEREKDEVLLNGGRKLAEAAERGSDPVKEAKGLK
jgi:hypothetical protein